MNLKWADNRNNNDFIDCFSSIYLLIPTDNNLQSARGDTLEEAAQSYYWRALEWWSSGQ